jgi:hypothetical protein
MLGVSRKPHDHVYEIRATLLNVGLTRKKDLRDGRAVWKAFSVPKIAGTPLHRATRADVVMGAGISGALLAQALTEAGFRPLIIERRRAA